MKFIELGWDIPDTAFLRANAASMEASTPFDGVMFKLKAKDGDGKRIESQSAWDARPWKRDWLTAAVDDLKACRFTRFTDNFLRFNATPGTLAWNDDAGWAALAEKAGHCAWLVKQGGCRGLALDFESYGATQFRFDTSKGLSFADTARLARRRGAEFVAATAREFPDAVLLALWLNSINFKAGDSDDPDALLAAGHYGLLPAFVDGMLDALPPGMTLVDGCENGYYMDSAEEYLRAAHGMRAWSGPAVRLVSPENRGTYRRQVQAGFGFYLDMFLNEEGNRYYRPPLDGSRLARLERNLGFARDAADEYVWVYGEQCRWWNVPVHAPKSVGKGRHWEEAMPGITQAIATVRDPVDAARQRIALLVAAGALSNLVVNADLSQPATTNAGARPASFGAWQDERKPTGTFTWDGAVGGGSACARKVAWGCFLQSVDARPGARYAVQADALPRGRTNPTLVVRWQTAEGRWTHEIDDCTFSFKAAGGDWKQAFGVAKVPSGAGKLVVLLNVTGQLSDGDACWFDNVKVFRL